MGFGAWAAGGGGWAFAWGPQDYAESIAPIRHAVSRGVNWIDTAAVYGYGHSEEVVGRALADIPRGERPLVFTKCGLRWNDADRMAFPVRDSSPARVREECEASLRRLGTDVIDLYQFHWPDQTGVAVEDSWGAMLRLAAEGKIRLPGVSNFDTGLLDRCEAVGHVVSLQPPFSAIRRDVAFCKKEIKGLRDIKGMKVRVYDQSLAQFVESLGAIPVSIGFSETQQALARGVVECAITGPSSANTAGWPEVSEYFMPIAFHVGFNGYIMNLNSWKKLNRGQQKKLQTAIDALNKDIWAYSEDIFMDAVRCNVGKDPCTTVTKFKMKEVPVTDADKQLLSDAVAKISFPAWSAVCERSTPGCGPKWKEILGPPTGIK